jgi:hypothetical protein
MIGGIKVNENWKERYNEELMQLFGVLGKLSVFRRSRLNLIGHVNRTDIKNNVKSSI